RFITNRSSGKMGVALISCLIKRGAEVVAVTGNISVPFPVGAKRIDVKSTREMYEEVVARVNDSDYILMPAAPADYRPAEVFDNKLKGDCLTLKLVKNADIAKQVGLVKGDRKLVIFCAETQDLEANAKSKLISKNADMVVANDVTKEGAGFETDTNIVMIIDNNRTESYPLMTKEKLADLIIDRMSEL
ncbi:MAG: phosphopantothenoylcysteine decarboxylase, partial [Clostridia bacterium]|nr:phosphopantothenoylcysteine decarboxylase [Clostridia bacterium]